MIGLFGLVKDPCLATRVGQASFTSVCGSGDSTASGYRLCKSLMQNPGRAESISNDVAEETAPANVGAVEEGS